MSDDNSFHSEIKKNGSSYIIWIQKKDAEWLGLSDKFKKNGKKVLVTVSLSFKE